MKNLSQITQADAAERPKAPKRRVARNNVSRLQIDNEQIMVAGTVYQSWLRDTSDIIGKRRKVNQVLS
jgi:cohesin complex subunit SCC1